MAVARAWSKTSTQGQANLRIAVLKAIGMFLASIASATGKGLFAGIAGTAAMTASSTIEMKLRHRKASVTPALAFCKALGIELTADKQKAALFNAVHWLYGASWGAPRGIIAELGVRGFAATALHFAAVWGSELIMLPAMGTTKPAWELEPMDVAVDALHHLVYSAVTSAAYEAIDS